MVSPRAKDLRSSLLMDTTQPKISRVRIEGRKLNRKKSLCKTFLIDVLRSSPGGGREGWGGRERAEIQWNPDGKTVGRTWGRQNRLAGWLPRAAMPLRNF